MPFHARDRKVAKRRILSETREHPYPRIDDAEGELPSTNLVSEKPWMQCFAVKPNIIDHLNVRPGDAPRKVRRKPVRGEIG